MSSIYGRTLVHALGVSKRLPQALHSVLGRQLVRPGNKPDHALWACVISSTSQNYLQNVQPCRNRTEPVYVN